MPNKLASQTSPYLLQHADNPVNWYPWGHEALTLSIKRDKPILLSIGYSACHWCHVMERECFENPDIAMLMNEQFVCIKVDREERPDLDKIYQLSHQILTQRSGGWPLTVVLTPNGHAPIFAGTYFPPVAKSGMPAFPDVLHQVTAHYKNNRKKMDEHAESFSKALSKLNPTTQKSGLPDRKLCLQSAVIELSEQFDSEHGGFNGAPKFPHPTQLEIILRHAHETQDAQSLEMVVLSLDKMATGGLFDQLGGGFFRYSVDDAWCIPHFEKMLYDNAQLLSLYVDAYHLTGKPLYREIADRVAQWVIGEMQQPDGGYSSTLDADSEGEEGLYYVWESDTLKEILNADEYKLIENYFGLSGTPNFDGKWHFNIDTEIKREFNTEHLNAVLDTLIRERSCRARPDLDDKVLTAWNGLMIKAMAKAGRVLDNSQYSESALKALDFVKDSLWRENRLLATIRNGTAHLAGYLDDYAFLLEGVIELMQVIWRDDDLKMSIELADNLLGQFEDPELGGFFFTAHDHEQLLYRPKSGPDDAIPSGNGSAIISLLKLGHILGETRYIESAEKALHLFARDLRKHPSVFGTITLSRLAAEGRMNTIIIRSQSEHGAVALQKEGQSTYRPDTVIIRIPASASDLPRDLALKIPGESDVAYVCTGFTCSEPITTESQLSEKLNQLV